MNTYKKTPTFQVNNMVSDKFTDIVNGEVVVDNKVVLVNVEPLKKREILKLKSKSKPPILEKLPQLNDNKDFVISLIKQNPQNYKFASEKLRNDISVSIIAFERDGLLMKYAGEKVKKSRIATSTAVKNNGLALEYAEIKYQDDNDLVAIAMNQNKYAKAFVGPRIKLKFHTEKKKQVLMAVATDGTLLRFVEPEFKNDFDVVWTAVNQNGLALQYASSRLKSDRFIVNESVKQFADSIMYAGKFLKHDSGVIDIAEDNALKSKNKPNFINLWKNPYYNYSKYSI